jgi:hypothetical protein
MSRVADFMYRKYVAPLEDAFIAEYGRDPTSEEDASLWEKAFQKVEEDQKKEKP